MTTGPWKPVSLHTYKTRIDEVRVNVDVAEKLDADVNVSFSLAGVMRETEATVSLVDAAGTSIVTQTLVLAANKTIGPIKFKLEKGNFNLWFPVGYGEQPLYSAKVDLRDTVCHGAIRRCAQYNWFSSQDGATLDTKTYRFGFRRVRVVEDELDEGHTFLFEVNNIRIFCGGSSYVYFSTTRR